MLASRLPHPCPCAEHSAFTAYRQDEGCAGLPCFSAAQFNPVRALTVGIAASIGRAAPEAAACPQTLTDGRLRVGPDTALLARRYK